MRRRSPVMKILSCLALATGAAMLSNIGGCGPVPFDAFFEQSSDENIFGTLVDDRGSFEFNLNPVTGNIQRIDADNGTITPPTDGQDLSVDRIDGGSLTVSPEGASDVIVAIRGDATFGDLDVQVARDSLDGLAPLVRANARAILQERATCEDNQEFLKGVCSAAGAIDVDEIVTLVREDLEGQGSEPPPAAVLRTLLVFYLEPFLDCCLAWEEFRNAGGEACSSG